MADGVGYGGPLRFTWQADSGGYDLHFGGGFVRRANSTEAQLIAAITRNCHTRTTELKDRPGECWTTVIGEDE